MTMPLHTDVLIVGAGPAGMALRLALQRLGIAALQVDKHAAGLNTSRAAVIHARTLEVLEPLGVVPALLAHGLKVQDFRIRQDSDVLLHIGFAAIPSTYPFALLCPQNRTEAILQAQLDAAGLAVTRPARLAFAAQGVDGITATLALPDGGSQSVQARWVVGCDGARSAVRDLAGIAFEGGDYSETFVLADVRMDGPSRDEVSLYFSVHGLMVVAPLPEDDGGSTDRYRVVATVAAAAELPVLAEVQALVDERSPGARVRELLWSSSFHLQHRIAAEVHRGRYLLCGDAAHVHSPAGGQGMNIGIQDAVELAAPLALALREGDLAGIVAWARHRHEVAREVVRMTDGLTRMATVSSGVGRAVRDAVLGVVGHSEFLRQKVAVRLAELEE
ncbi:FAD-dependent monooxygenase [Pseudoduganella chitinolytica]|uniref:FAD-dependent monooxygenase n=1 Tax=Pseudoduganella chitinolytica TaxID=34070 RepID=A0ABY8BHM2_9BURK|nr:FAD-dependent monooxygenase [Pseudoduganella chitinolytica]WEF35461.1 FAD-dependent monooxygenase [Pseudoduganella chitinolytica]